MEKYKNLSCNSSIDAFELADGSITILFDDGWLYQYSIVKAGSENIAQMKLLAKNGHGLNSYIIKNVRKLYDKKWR